MTRRHVVVVGGGYAGLTVGRRLARKGRDVDITIVNPTGYMTYQPLLPEVAAGTVQPAHVVVPLRTALPRAAVLTGALTGLDAPNRVAEVTTLDGAVRRLHYDELVLAMGSVTRMFSIPGLVDHAIGFRTLEEALHLGNRVLARLEFASGTTSKTVSQRALTFVVIGGGYAGIEALAELEDMVRRAIKRFPNLSVNDTRWMVVEAGGRILAQLPERMSVYVAAHLEDRGVEVRTATTAVALGPGSVTLSGGEEIPADTVVWTAGVVASPILRRLGLPCDETGRVVTDEYLRVANGIWALGDCAAVPDLYAEGACPPTAQHAVRQARRVADNILGFEQSYQHRDVGAVASLGLRKGVAELYGVQIRGHLAWLLHRLYHGSRLPCSRRRVLVILAWLLGSRGRDPVALHALETPRAALREAYKVQSETGGGLP